MQENTSTKGDNAALNKTKKISNDFRKQEACLAADKFCPDRNMASTKAENSLAFYSSATRADEWYNAWNLFLFFVACFYVKAAAQD